MERCETQEPIAIASSGNVDLGEGRVGGLIGHSLGDVVDSEAWGDCLNACVSGPQEVGGLIGKNEGNINCPEASAVSLSRSASCDAAADPGCDAVIASPGNSVGGLVGWSLFGNISGCQVDTVIWGQHDVGGLVGLSGVPTLVNSGGLISNSQASGVVRGTDRVGGLVGRGLGTVDGSDAFMDVVGMQQVGGAMGVLEGMFLNGSAEGFVEGHSEVGGLVGYAQTGTLISTSVSTGSVVGLDDSVGTFASNVGGLVGAFKGTLLDGSTSFSPASGGFHVGGLVGTLDGVVRDCGALTGPIFGEEMVGGLVGRVIGGSIDRSMATVDADADGQIAGGLVGMLSIGTSIDQSFATGDVTIPDGNYGGGLVGLIPPDPNGTAGASVSNSYALGAVNMGFGSFGGGLIGSSDAFATTVTNCFSNSLSVVADEFLGGLVGSSVSVISNSYRALLTGSSVGNPLTSSQFMDPSSFVTWDFVGIDGNPPIWILNGGDPHPTLGWEVGLQVPVP